VTSRIGSVSRLNYYSTFESQNKILETLVTLVSEVEGAREFHNMTDRAHLVSLAKVVPLILTIFKYSWISLSNDHGHQFAVWKDMDDIIPKLLHVFKDSDGVTLLQALADLLPSLPPEVSETSKLCLALQANQMRSPYLLSHPGSHNW